MPSSLLPRTALLLALALTTACIHHTFPNAPPADASRWAAVGEAAPQFTLPSLDGPEVRLSSYAGRVVVVDFWATFCGPCRAELPVLVALRRRHPDVEVLAISIDDDSSDGLVRSAVHDLGLDFPVLRDPEGSVAFLYMKQPMAPLTVVVGRNGAVRSVHRGYGSKLGPRLEDEIQAALAEEASPDHAPIPVSLARE